MSDSKVKEEARRLQLGRRVKRGIVASYIHELSARHRADAGTQSRELALATARKT
jgi:hypothetical protein